MTVAIIILVLMLFTPLLCVPFMDINVQARVFAYLALLLYVKMWVAILVTHSPCSGAELIQASCDLLLTHFLGYTVMTQTEWRTLSQYMIETTHYLTSLNTVIGVPISLFGSLLATYYAAYGLSAPGWLLTCVLAVLPLKFAAILTFFIAFVIDTLLNRFTN